MPDAKPHRRLRFTLRAMFIVIALAAFVLAWYVLPELTARRFAAHINAGRYDDAVAMLPKGSSPQLAEVAAEPDRRRAGATIDRPSWSDLWLRRREANVVISRIYAAHESPGLSAFVARYRVEGRSIEPIPFEEGGLLP